MRARFGLASPWRSRSRSARSRSRWSCTKRERDNFEARQRNDAVRAAHQAEALAALSVGQLSSASAFYRAEGHFSRHEFGTRPGAALRLDHARAGPGEVKITVADRV